MKIVVSEDLHSICKSKSVSSFDLKVDRTPFETIGFGLMKFKGILWKNWLVSEISVVIINSEQSLRMRVGHLKMMAHNKCLVYHF